MKTDTDLQYEIVEEIAGALGQEVALVDVWVAGGMVTLTGRVSSFIEKWLAEYIALYVYGVRAVVNQIEIWQSALDPDGSADALDDLQRAFGEASAAGAATAS